VVKLAGSWLQSSQVEALQQHLDVLWQEQGAGSPICFTWLDWIKSSALGHLGIKDTLLITQSNHVVLQFQNSFGVAGSACERMI
jgi:RWD domain